MGIDIDIDIGMYIGPDVNICLDAPSDAWTGAGVGICNGGGIDIGIEIDREDSWMRC